MVYEVYCTDKHGNKYFRSKKMLPSEAIEECCKYGKDMEVWMLDDTGEELIHVCR